MAILKLLCEADLGQLIWTFVYYGKHLMMSSAQEQIFYGTLSMVADDFPFSENGLTA